jgi:hypothetical protein
MPQSLANWSGSMPEYSSKSECVIFAGTWNVNGKVCLLGPYLNSRAERRTAAYQRIVDLLVAARHR